MHSRRRSAPLKPTVVVGADGEVSAVSGSPLPPGKMGSSIAVVSTAAESEHSPFPKRPDHSGYLDFRTKKTRAWQRKYFVLSNNFLLMARSPLDTALEAVVPLEGSVFMSKAMKKAAKKAKKKKRKKSEYKEEDEESDDSRVHTPLTRRGTPVTGSSLSSSRSLSASSTRSSKKKKKKVRIKSVFTAAPTFDLIVRKKRFCFKAGNTQEAEAWMEKLYTASRLKIKDIYHLQSLLAENDTGTTKVMSAVHKITSEKVAIKAIVKSSAHCEDADECFRRTKSIQREIMALRRISHPHIVALYDIYESKNSIYLILEFCVGGELFNRIVDTGGRGFNERAALLVTQQIASAVQYCHSKGIVHRDLKPENVLCVRIDSLTPIKITDFGISSLVFDPKTVEKQIARRSGFRKRVGTAERMSLITAAKSGKMKMFPTTKSRSTPLTGVSPVRDEGAVIDELPTVHPSLTARASGVLMRSSVGSVVESMSTMCGTVNYTAPEILLGNPYDFRVDNWSVGVILYILLCGYPPFFGNSPYEISQAIVSEALVFEVEDWAHVSEKGKTLVRSLLDKSPRRRADLDEVFNHAWLTAAKTLHSERRSRSFRTTVATRNILKRRLSMDVFERKSKRMDKLYAHSSKARRSLTFRSRDDSMCECDCVGPTHRKGCAQRTGLLTRKGFASAYERAGDSTLDHMLGSHKPRFSKTDDELLQLRMPWTTIVPSSMALIDRGMDSAEALI